MLQKASRVLNTYATAILTSIQTSTWEDIKGGSPCLVCGPDAVRQNPGFASRSIHRMDLK